MAGDESLPRADWTFGELYEIALREGATKIHLTLNSPPMMRLADRSIAPAGGGFAPITVERLMRELSVLVEPEKWDELEQQGEGEVSLLSTYGAPLKLSLYRVGGNWSAVVHL